jgi:dihydrofolate reductase
MRNIVYYVAISLDGFISGKDGDNSGFIAKGNGVDRYLTDLKEFDTVIMGRKTYESGYDYGLVPGQLAYPHMKHYVFSGSLDFEDQHEHLQVVEPNLESIDQLKNKSGSDIYLCGGGQFAGWLLDHRRVDVLKIKLNPFLQGNGVKLFGDSSANYQLKLLDSKLYDEGLQIMTFKVNH